MTACLGSLHKVLWAQRREASSCQPPSLLPHDPSRNVGFDRLGFLLNGLLFCVRCKRPSHMLADAACMSHIAKAVLAALASTGETVLKTVVDWILDNSMLVALAALILYEVEVFAGCQVKYLGAFRDLLRSNVADVCCDLFDSCHLFVSLSLFVLFTDIIIP